jgi:hypothetical protein
MADVPYGSLVCVMMKINNEALELDVVLLVRRLKKASPCISNNLITVTAVN